MKTRTCQGPDVRFDSEIEFCAPSWNRKNKYVSWQHWLATKSRRGTAKEVDRSLRYKLYEIGHYCGSVILEIGFDSESGLLIGLAAVAARQAGHEVQYFGIDRDADSIAAAEAMLKKRRLDQQSIVFRGSLSEFRNVAAVTPTMVIINETEKVDQLLKHLSLFLQPETPVLLTGWFESRADLRSLPNLDEFECCGRFGESVLLLSAGVTSEAPVVLDSEEFAGLRTSLQDDSGADSAVSQSRPASESVARSGKSWPFSRNENEYPATLPDGTPWPKISIVTPTYNQGQFIEETINSVIKQDYPNLEYIMVDGGSTDQTPEILQRYADHFDHLISEPDEGQSDAINKGMQLATGEILTWLNSDDMLTPGTLFAMAMAFWKSGADMVVGTVQMLKDGKIVEEHLTSCPDGPLQLSELLDLDNNWLQGRFFFQPELMFTRDLWDRAGGFVDNELYYSMDHELWLRFAIAGANLHVIGRPTVMYRMHDQQKTHEDYQPELRTVNRRYIEKYGVPKVPRADISPRRYRVAFVNDVGPRYGAGIAHGRLRDAIEAAGHENVFIFAKESDNAESKTVTQIYSEIESFNPDLVMFGNLHNAGLGMDLVEKVADRWATTFVLHDLWATTGRCCYAGSCEKYLTGCDASCPTAEEYPAMQPEHIEPAFHHKLEVISRPRRVVMLANSEWTRQQAESSAIGSRGVVRTLKYAFPMDVFQPRDKNVCREILGLPQDKFIALFASVDVAEDRKGLRHLFEAFNRLKIPDLQPVCIGHAHDNSALYPGALALGYVEDPWKAALIYSAADIFVGPSLQEAFGQVFVEAAACGTPAIAYNTCGVTDAIVDGVTGLFAKQVHPSELASAIDRLYRDPDYRRDLGRWGRIEVENEWSHRSSYHRFNNLLREFPEHIGFLPPAKIKFDPPAGDMFSSKGQTFGILERGTNSVLHEDGFCTPEQFQHADGSTSTVRWAVDNECHLRVRITQPGKFSLNLNCLNPVDDQVINVYCNGHHARTIQLDNEREFTDGHQLQLLDQLSAGDYRVRIEFSGSYLEPSGLRNLALLFVELSFKQSQTLEHPLSVAA